MNTDGFSHWAKWDWRDELPSLQYPGVYALAIAARALSGRPFIWTKDIVYFGMTNARAGLKGRLDQFDRATRGQLGHGGAGRFMFRHPDRDTLIDRLYVAVYPIECDPRSNEAPDLRLMGEVAWFEYECFARFVDKYGRLPEFNDKEMSPKSTAHRPAGRSHP